MVARTDLACIAVTRLAEGTRRVAVARVGLAVTALGFAVAALPLGAAVTNTGVIVGGAGAGGALASSGAALAALRNPNRMSAANGLVHRAVRSLPPNEPKFIVPLNAALPHATLDSAASFDADTRIGRVRSGMYAALVVLDGDFLCGGNLLDVTVARTIVGGETVFRESLIRTHG